VKVGQVLAYLAAEGEEIGRQESGGVGGKYPVSRDAESSERSAGKTLRSEDSASRLTPTMSAAIRGGRVRAVTPRARRVARELHIDVAALTGSGRHGRIRERDVRAATAHQTPGSLIPHTRARRAIAARMVAGVTQAAPVTLTTKADATRLIALRNQLKTNGPAAPSYTDLILLLTAATLRQHPLLQAQWRDDGLFVPDAIDIAIAVDVEFGLLAPVVRHVDQLGVNEIAAQTRDLIAQARAGKLTPDQMRGAAFTVTNLGMFGIDAFTPIIQLPQCAVLGVGRIVKEPAVVQDRIEPRDMITLSLTFDHRVVDGAPAARFLDALRRAIGQPPPVG
jgi:pyruvate dehydrogenase E2 component (dihydrolipoamide acetyltransferase)